MRSVPAFLCAAALAAVPLAPGHAAGPAARTARASRGVHFSAPQPATAGDPLDQTCFESAPTLLLNPGCFTSAGGDCTSHSSQYFIQSFVPNFTAPHRITGFGFISNDGATVFPAGGVVVIPFAENRFPRPDELAALQAHAIPTPHDTATVAVDLTPFDIRVTSDVEVWVCLQFPEGGVLDAVGSGPGIAVDEVLPDQPCDFFTGNGGTTYFTNLESDPLDWAFELRFEAVLPVAARTWSEIKRQYGIRRTAPLYGAAGSNSKTARSR